MAKLTLSDIKPQEFTFKLSSFPDATFTLKKFSLAEQIWAEEKFGENGVTLMLKEQKMFKIAELAHHLLKDKTLFPTFMDFAGGVVTIEDKIEVVRGLLATIGMSQPVIEKIAQQEVDKLPKTQAPAESQPTGATSLTSSHQSTDTPPSSS